jgi:hypothetical protein
MCLLELLRICDYGFMSKQIRSYEKGSFAYENWKTALGGSPLKNTLEYPLFTDSHIIGDLPNSESPYKLFNVVAIRDEQILAPAIVLRMDYFSEVDIEVLRKTDIDRFHGGGISDEIAALVSLSLGIRLKAGGFTRLFELGKDTKGQPVSWNLQDNPVLLKTSNQSVLPQALGSHNLSDAARVASLQHLSAPASIALVRAARLYQDALWIVESEPSLSWVMLVSAVETAANYWRPSKEPAVERMRLFDPKLEEILIQAGGSELAMQVAERIAGFIGSTRKFVDFILEFLPEPPKGDLFRFCVSGDNQPFQFLRRRLCHQLDLNCSTNY